MTPSVKAAVEAESAPPSVEEEPEIAAASGAMLFEFSEAGKNGAEARLKKLRDIEREHVEHALEYFRNDTAAAARELGITESELREILNGK